MADEIRPALTSTEWNERRSGPVSINVLNDETHLVVRDPDNEVVSVSGSDELHALIALANDALPEDDRRKLTRRDIAVLGIIVDHIDRSAANGERLAALAEELFAKLAALVPR